MKTYVFDIDGTICTLAGPDYNNSTPIIDRIEYINSLYDSGDKIYFQTARGMGRHQNNQAAAIEEFYEFTVRQLNEWGVKFHGLFLGKPAADIYIDDKGVSDENFFADQICS